MTYRFLFRRSNLLVFRRSSSTFHSFKHSMEPLVVIFGSTGTGKSDLAVELATRFNGEIINADAMQMYEGLPIITNKITTEEQRGVPHHLLGNIRLGENPWTVVEFKEAASKIITEIRSRGKLPIVVGGSTYYLDGLLYDDRLIKDKPVADVGAAYRDELIAKFPILSEPVEVLLEKLREVDPVMAAKWHPKDERKIRNSLEIYYTYGRPASEIYAEQQLRKESKAQAEGSMPTQSPFNVLLFWLYAKHEVLTERLDKRVDKMLERGLLDETAQVYDWYCSKLASGETVDPTKGIVQSIGFWQFEPYLRTLKEGAESSELAKLKDIGVEQTKGATRRYAKYQVKWISTKTLPSLKDEHLLDRFFLLDSTNVQTWQHEVAEKATELTSKLLAGEALPRPEDVSETAKEALAAAFERSSRQSTPCYKKCDVCDKTFLTEELWQKHVKGQKHRTAEYRAKRRALAEFHPKKTALAVVEDGQADNTEPANQ